MQAGTQANTWNRKALLCSFETSRTQILLPAMVLLLDIAFFSVGTAIVLLADNLLLKLLGSCLLYTSPSPRDRTRSRMPSSA